MWALLKRYFQNLPRRYRRYFVRFHHHYIDIPRQKRALARYETAITSVADGLPDTGSGQYCIFVLFPRSDGLSANVLKAIAAMGANGINVLVCLNARLAPNARTALLSRVHRVIDRQNVGYDFGAYKDCVRLIASGEQRAERVLFLNDSVFFTENGLSDFFVRMMAEYDAVSAFENWGDKAENHFQSFAVSVSAMVFYSEPFQDFWQRYLPVSSRLYAIEQGEKKLSAAILQSARTTHTVYSCDQLYKALVRIDPPAVYSDLIVPIRLRRRLPVDESGQVTLPRNARDVISIVNASSPIHAGAWLFPRFLNAPLIKKDIVYRQRFRFWEVQALFRDLLSEQEFAEFCTFLRERGNNHKLSGFGRARYEIGIG